MNYPQPLANKPSSSRFCRTSAGLLVAMSLLLSGAAGCGPQPDANKSAADPAGAASNQTTATSGTQGTSPAKSAASNSTANSSGDSTRSIAKPAPAADTGPTVAQQRAKMLADAQSQLAADDWDSLDKTLQSIADLPSDDQTAEQATAIEQLISRAATRREEAVAQQRATRLTQAQFLIAGGRLDDAQRAIADVLTRGPSDEQRATAQSLTDEIERIRKARRQLKSWIQLLGSAERKDVQAAQTQLLLDPDTALGMVLDALRATNSPEQATNYVETLGLLERPDIVMPEYIELLKDETREAIWPVIQQQLTAPGVAGAGEALLSLAMQAKKPEQRQAAWEALGGVADPPAGTLIVAAGVLKDADLATVPVMLRAAAHAALIHQQQDLVARRGLPPLNAAEEASLSTLLGQLDQWTAATPTTPVPEQILPEARRLATILGRLVAPPLTGLKIARVESELTDSPAAALLDGVWNSVEPKSMWRYPIAQRGVVLIDLGQERLVTGVRIWNLNETSGAARGWKEMELFVSENPAELMPITTAVLPTAPGIAQPTDYGTTLAVPPTRARYIRLQAKSTWTADVHSGLSEVQVLGW